MEITKFRSQRFAAFGQTTVYLQRTKNMRLRLARSIAKKRWRLQEPLRARENDLRKLLASSLDAIVVTNGTITELRSQLFAAFGQTTVYLQRTQNTLLRLARSIAEKRRRLREALRAREDDLRELLASSLEDRKSVV